MNSKRWSGQSAGRRRPAASCCDRPWRKSRSALYFGPSRTRFCLFCSRRFGGTRRQSRGGLLRELVACQLAQRARSVYDAPLKYARGPGLAVDAPPHVNILAIPPERRSSSEPWHTRGVLNPFAVAKDADRDRLVLDSRPASQLEDFPAKWVFALAAPSTVFLQPDERLLLSGTDLRDDFYQFSTKAQRTVRNLLKVRLSLPEAEDIFDRALKDCVQQDGGVYVGLSSLAMGDSSACEFAQCAHLAVLVQGDVIQPYELLTQNSPAPRALTSGDLVILERVLASEIAAISDISGRTEGSARLDRALAAYGRVSVEYNPKKTFRDSAQATCWGVDCCGVSGLVRPAPGFGACHYVSDSAWADHTVLAGVPSWVVGCSLLAETEAPVLDRSGLQGCTWWVAPYHHSDFGFSDPWRTQGRWRSGRVLKGYGCVGDLVAYAPGSHADCRILPSGGCSSLCSRRRIG